MAAVELVRQRGRNDCGVACLAMIAGVPYEAAHAAFLECGLGVARGRKAALSSNFAEIVRAGQALGLALAMRRFKSWDNIAARAILKVMRQRSGNWHWVVASRGPFGIQILDPACDLPSYQHPPLDVPTVDFGLYQSCGNIVETTISDCLPRRLSTLEIRCNEDVRGDFAAHASLF